MTHFWPRFPNEAFVPLIGHLQALFSAPPTYAACPRSQAQLCANWAFGGAHKMIPPLPVPWPAYIRPPPMGSSHLRAGVRAQDGSNSPDPALPTRVVPLPVGSPTLALGPLTDLWGWLLSDQHCGEPLHHPSHAPWGSRRPWNLRVRPPGAVRLCERSGCPRAACPTPTAGQAPQKEAQPQAVPTQPDLQVSRGWGGCVGGSWERPGWDPGPDSTERTGPPGPSALNVHLRSANCVLAPETHP